MPASYILIETFQIASPIIGLRWGGGLPYILQVYGFLSGNCWYLVNYHTDFSDQLTLSIISWQNLFINFSLDRDETKVTNQNEKLSITT